ncbi:MAG: peptidoglycan DD-metalloendopeptidase family protein [Deltaproteobacteria bacterium]|nr:peptidoglycan DD-metalloendopeptidase family protein [Deltaproteobacteria bacterium]
MFERPKIFRAHSLHVFFAFLFSLILPFPPAASSYDSDTKKKQIEQIETDLSREKEQSMELEIKERDLLGQLAEIEKRIAEKRKSVEKVKEALRLNRNELKSQEMKLGHLEEVASGVREKLAERLVAFYKYARRGYVHLFVSSSNMDQLRKRMKYLQVIMAEDQRLLAESGKLQQEINEEIILVREKLNVIEEMKKTESARVSAVKRELDNKVLLLMKVHEEKKFHDTLVEELQLGAENLGETLLSLDRERKEKKSLPLGFEESKGKLPLPFQGKIMRNQDWWGVDMVNTHKGLFIQGTLREEVKSVFAGRVDFSGQLRGYGETIIINHGSRYFTVSAYLAERHRKEGDMVQKGDVIGLLGDAGPPESPQLYFEIRRAGTPLDPLKWVKVH